LGQTEWDIKYIFEEIKNNLVFELSTDGKFGAIGDGEGC
jgi:hypothetical protein